MSHTNPRQERDQLKILHFYFYFGGNISEGLGALFFYGRHKTFFAAAKNTYGNPKKIDIAAIREAIIECARKDI